jgi:hypothetical protein
MKIGRRSNAPALLCSGKTNVAFDGHWQYKPSQYKDFGSKDYFEIACRGVKVTHTVCR